jgi:hypothetical protein
MLSNFPIKWSKQIVALCRMSRWAWLDSEMVKCVHLLRGEKETHVESSNNENGLFMKRIAQAMLTKKLFDNSL